MLYDTQCAAYNPRMNELIETLLDYDWLDDETIYIHRGPDECNHVDDDCWCYPLELTLSAIQSYTEDELRDLLETFLALH